MPPARAVLDEPGVPIPLSELQWEMYELPEPGTRYWHGSIGYRVQAVEPDAAPARVDLIRDPEWEAEAYGDLPEGYQIDAGRRSDDGTWHVRVLRPNGQPLGGGWSFGDDCETVLSQAVTGALAQLQGEAGG